MAVTEFTAALNQVASERNISPDDVIDTLKSAMIAAYKKEVPEITEEEVEELKVEVNPNNGEVKILSKGKDVTPAGFGRIASQTAKQVILQKIREAEKRSIAEEYKQLIGTIVQGYIFRIDHDTVIMDIGKTHGILPVSEQISSERYLVNQKYKVLVKDVSEDESGRSASVILSRSDKKFIEVLFEQEVPEISQGIVKIESIAREPGERTKVAVSSSDEKVDPSGACIGQRGIRVQAVTDELNGEKVDIINYNPDSDKFIAAALAPAHVLDVVLDEESKSAVVKVSEDQLSLAIGNNGQNARLAAKLTGWRINLDGSDVDVSPEEADEESSETEEPSTKVSPEENKEKQEMSESTNDDIKKPKDSDKDNTPSDG